MRFVQVLSSTSGFNCQPLGLLYNIKVTKGNGSELSYSELFIGLPMDRVSLLDKVSQDQQNNNVKQQETVSLLYLL